MPRANPENQPKFSEDAAPISAIDQFNLFDKAAKKDLHWWFFALLMIGMLAIGFLYTDMRREREGLRSEITAVRDSQMAFVTTKSEAMMAALMNNTRALEANTQTLNRLENRRSTNE